MEENSTLTFLNLSYDVRAYSVAGAVTSIAGWSSLYMLLHFVLPGRSHEWHCRMVTMMHGFVIVSMAAWSGFVQGPWPLTDPAGPNTPLQCLTCIVTLGYFTFDLMWCLYFKTEGPFMLFHHVLSIFGQIFVLYRNINGTEMMATLFGTELTNPVLQLRWFLRYGSGVGAYPPVVLALVDFVFLALFTLMRIVLASMLLNRYLNHPRPDFIARFFAITIYLVGWGFWLLLLRYTFRKYIKRFFVEKKSSVDSVPASSAGSGDSTGNKDQ